MQLVLSHSSVKVITLRCPFNSLRKPDHDDIVVQFRMNDVRA